MSDKKIVTINGKTYDAATGLPVAKPNLALKTSPAIHSVAHRTATLRDNTKRTISAIKPGLKKVGRSMDIARSKSISHFNSQKTNANKPNGANNQTVNVTSVRHPLAVKASSKRVVTPKPVVKSSKQIKDEAIDKALANASRPKVNKPKPLKHSLKYVNVFTISLLALVVIGYFTYINMPSLSVRIASAQAGIDATYPDYRPDGYSSDGPVTYSDDEVLIKFKANTGNSSFMIKQSKSTWDSSAVKNQVNRDSNGEFLTQEKNGQTIFTYGNNATWVNGGILYTITGNTRLSTDQVLRIATSL